jgi:hypothetical protein
VKNDAVTFVSEGDAVEVMIRVRPGCVVDARSHGEEETDDGDLGDHRKGGGSWITVGPAPDSWYIARRSLGVIAFRRFVWGSALANAVSSPLVLD